MTESGVLHGLKTKWWPSQEGCQKSALVGASAKAAISVDIPQVCKYFFKGKTVSHVKKQVCISAGAFILLLAFLIVGLIDALCELANAIKSNPEYGPMGKALKTALCGCLPPMKKKTVASNEDDKEKQNGAENNA